MARSLYIHWPFCERKCPYCDFNSHVRASVDEDIWEAALLSDMRYEAEVAGKEPLHSIFFGGGTPSLMPPHLVERLIDEAHDLRGFAEDIEVTLEANPSSVESGRFTNLASAGINRISIGIQSFEDHSLQFLGRLHSATEALEALEIARNNFARVSFDLIYALPDHTPQQWEAQLSRALDYGTEHLSLYQLTIEPGTRFASDVRKGKFTPLDGNQAADLYDITQEMTQAAGLPAYEISNHARRGCESRHNLTYWRYQDYCGIGPGAHGRRAGYATERHKKPENYLKSVEMKRDGTQIERVLGQMECVSEALLMGLRLREGVQLEPLANRFGIAPDAMLDEAKIALYQSYGHIWRKDGAIGVTPKGMPLLDGLLAELIHPQLVAA